MHSIRRYIIFSFLGLSFLLWVTLAKLLSAVAYLSDIQDPAIIGSQFTASTLVALIIAVGAGLYTYRVKTVQRFAHDVIEELLKVAWPDAKTTRSATVVVIVTTVVVALLLGFFDLAWAEFTGIIYAPRS